MSRIRIAHSMGSIRQPSENDCWAAALAMVIGRRGGRPVWVNHVKRDAVAAGVRLNPNGSLPNRNTPNTNRLATALGLRMHNVMSRSFNLALVQTLLRPGPFAILGDFEYSGAQRFHVVAVYRLFGDGSADGTTISIVDPFDGRYANHVWSSFYDAETGHSFLVDPHYVIG